jgi:hypothetical protein
VWYVLFCTVVIDSLHHLTLQWSDYVILYLTLQLKIAVWADDEVQILIYNNCNMYRTVRKSDGHRTLWSVFVHLLLLRHHTLAQLSVRDHSTYIV